MAKPNYSYEKRQKELAKKHKQEEKRKKKGGKPATEDGSQENRSEAVPVGDVTNT
jgi:hypothetical protein